MSKKYILTNKFKMFFKLLSCCFLSFALLSFCFLNIGSSDAYASSTDFIQRNPYTLGINCIYCVSDSYTSDAEFPLDLHTAIGSHYLSFDSVGSVGNVSLIPEYNYISRKPDSIEFNTILFSSSHNSQRYRFTTTQPFNIPYVSLLFDPSNNYEFTTFDIYMLRCTELQININKSTFYDLPRFFNSINVCRYLIYKTSDNIIKYNVVYANSIDKLDTEPLMSIYYTFDSYTTGIVTGTYTYETSVLKIDRSQYISEEIVYLSPFDNFFGTIRNGVSEILGIEVFPNFYLGGVLSISFGVACISILLHFMIK